MHDLFLWLKALHIIAVVAWMAGLLYLPRLFVYHCRATAGGEADKMLQEMERRLLRIIMTPAMITTWILGLWIAVQINAFDPANGMWLHYKLMLVFLLSGMHGMMGRYRKDFAAGRNRKSEKFFRIFNEIPMIILIGIVFLVVLKPV